MKNKIHVLIVDDSVVIRRLVRNALEQDPEIEVVGTASNGKLALPKIEQLAPDIVILDIEMPEMDGLATLREIRKSHPRLPVIMFSTLTERGAAATLDALALGANDYLTKPAGAGSMASAISLVTETMVPKIRSLCGRMPAPPATELSAKQVPTPRRCGAGIARPQAVVIAVSTGGPNALAQLLPALPDSLSVPVLVVQHMPPTFTRLLAERLDSISPLAVAECEDGASVQAGKTWIARGDHHMLVRKRGAEVVLETNQDPPENSCRPAADVLFRSAAELWGRRLLGIVLTGMGSDGLKGAEIIHSQGGEIVAQDEASSVVWGMPGYVVRAGIASAVLPIDEIANEIVRRVGVGNATVPRPRLASSGK